MQVYLAKTGQWVTLPANPLGSGGQGAVYAAPHAKGLAIKIWNTSSRTQEAEDRATALCRWSPRDRRLSLPIELVLDSPNGKVIGFLMPHFPGVQLLAAFNPVAAKHLGARFQESERPSIAALVADVFVAIHAGRFRDVDANEGNFLVDKRWTGCEVYAIDCDSFEFAARDSTGQIREFRTDVAKEEYLAPELQGKNRANEPHTEATDLFSLAVLLWLILKGGAHPFSIRTMGNTALPPLGERIREGFWPYAPARPLPPSWTSVDAGIPWDELPIEIQDLFIRAFRDGHDDPSKRPSAVEWRDALNEWVEREREARSIAGLIVSAFRALAKARAVAWLSQKLSSLGSLFGWSSRARGGNASSGRLLRVLLVLLLLALAGYAAFHERVWNTPRNAAPSSTQRREEPWEPKKARERKADESWQGAPRLWKELVGENEEEAK